MKKYLVRTKLTGIYTCKGKGSNIWQQKKDAAKKVWQADLGDWNMVFNESTDIKAVENKNDSIVFKVNLSRYKDLYFEAQNEDEARIKADSFYKNHPTGDLEQPDFAILEIRKTEKRDSAGWQLIIEAFAALNEWFENNEFLETSFGEYPTSDGYRIKAIIPNATNRTVYIVVNSLSRAMNENDDVRAGDDCDFLYDAETKVVIPQ